MFRNSERTLDTRDISGHAQKFKTWLSFSEHTHASVFRMCNRCTCNTISAWTKQNAVQNIYTEHTVNPTGRRSRRAREAGMLRRTFWIVKSALRYQIGGPRSTYREEPGGRTQRAYHFLSIYGLYIIYSLGADVFARFAQTHIAYATNCFAPAAQTYSSTSSAVSILPLRLSLSKK